MVQVATINLNAMHQPEHEPLPWAVSFSYGKALQKTCIVTWCVIVNTYAIVTIAPSFLRHLQLIYEHTRMGKEENVPAAQAALLARAKANSDATRGAYVAGACPSVGVDGNVQQAAGAY
jgi:fructose-bisphosphate aldolase, class I